MADPRQTLQDLIRRFGISLAEEPQRCKGMLMDLCGSSRREIAGLVVAIEEKITSELMKPHPIVVSLRANMILRLENNRGLAPDIAMWTVDTWGLVLGTWTQAELDSFPPMRGYSSVTTPVTTPRSETPIDLAAVVVEPPQLDRSQDLLLTATECQRGVTKTIVLASGKRLEVNVPAGVKVGQRVRLQGHGAVDPVTGVVGDVYLVVQERSEEEISLYLLKFASGKSGRYGNKAHRIHLDMLKAYPGNGDVEETAVTVLIDLALHPDHNGIKSINSLRNHLAPLGVSLDDYLETLEATTNTNTSFSHTDL